jgi:hypothetical protein
LDLGAELKGKLGLVHEPDAHVNATFLDGMADPINYFLVNLSIPVT